jgi:hypothetical protein
MVRRQNLIITQIRLDPRSQTEDAPSVFTVGEPIFDGGQVVEKIKFFNPARNPFNSGVDTTSPVYVIYFEGIPERRVIREDSVSNFEAVAEKNLQQPIELPE